MANPKDSLPFLQITEAEKKYLSAREWTQDTSTRRWTSGSANYKKIPHDLAVQVQKDLDRRLFDVTPKAHQDEETEESRINRN